MTYSSHLLAGRALTIAYSAGTFAYAYDTADRQSQTTRPDSKIIKYGYDADSNTATITYPDSYLYTYGFDELDRMTDVFETPAGSSASSDLVHYTYDPLSRRTSLAYGNSTSTAYGYDAFDGLTTLAHTFLAGSTPVPALTYTYTRDQNERRQSDTVSLSGYLWHPPAAAATTYQPNSLNQYSSINGQALSYDNNGNLTADPTAALGSPTSYGFDQKNRLTSATNPQHTATYIYDPFNRRAGKTVDGLPTVYVDDGARTIAEYNNGGNEVQHYIYGADSTPIATEQFNGQPTALGIHYFYTDALGSVTFLADQTGKTTASFTYSPWGETTPSTSSNYRFAGMRLDTETMLYYDNARYYSPQQGRFISPDPIGAKGGVNIYSYVGNDPVDGVDLSGRNTVACHIDCGGAEDQIENGLGGGFEGLGPDPSENWSCSGNCGIFNAVFGYSGYAGTQALASFNSDLAALNHSIPTITVSAYDPNSDQSSSQTSGAPLASGGIEGQPNTVTGGSNPAIQTVADEYITVVGEKHVYLGNNAGGLPNESLMDELGCFASCADTDITITGGREAHRERGPKVHQNGDAADLGLGSNPSLSNQRSVIESCFTTCFNSDGYAQFENGSGISPHYHFQDVPNGDGSVGFRPGVYGGGIQR